MVNTCIICVEGGGDSKNEKIAFRKGLYTLIQKAGFKDRLPRFWPGGGRAQTFKDFKNALSTGSKKILLLVDSEESVASQDFGIDSPACWDHLKARDNWDKPLLAKNNQVALMATCMETWFITDRQALRLAFGRDLNENALPPMTILEARHRHDLLKALETATKNAGPKRAYKKGERSYQLLELIDPQILATNLPHFQRFLKILDLYTK